MSAAWPARPLGSASPTTRRRLRPTRGGGPCLAVREPVRRVSAACAVEEGGPASSVPWRPIGETVRVTVADGLARVSHAGREVAVHGAGAARRARPVDPARVLGGPRAEGRPVRRAIVAQERVDAFVPEPPRPLAEHEAAAGGTWPSTFPTLSSTG